MGVMSPAAAGGAQQAAWRKAAICGALLLAVFYMLSPPSGAGAASGSSSRLYRLAGGGGGGAGGACGRGKGALPLPALPKRSDLAKVLEGRGFKVGAELGVQRGIFAADMMRNWPSCEKYYLVDIWMQQTNYSDGANVGNNVQERIYEEAKARVADFGDVPSFLRMFTSKATAFIADESLDFVYVDARHDYCGAKEDMELYWPKLRPGGIMAGHDFVTAETVSRWTNGTQDWSLCADGTVHPGAVRGAAEEFAAAKGVTITVTGDGPPSFAVVKPC